MAKKKTITPPETGEKPIGLYFENDRGIDFFSTGCFILDLALGGGWAQNRIINVVGDKSTGKTLLAIEATANYAKKYPSAPIIYTEVESAFDPQYAAALGMPMDRITFTEDMFTVEDWYKHLEQIIEELKGEPALYILDSLDALSDEAELKVGISDPKMGTAKAKQLSALFRRINQKLAGSNITLIIISQVRENIGITFGRQTKRSGGRALDFYASQVLYLAHVGQVKRTHKGVERVVGIRIKAKVDKNKAGLPFREAEFQILFGYGVADLDACLDWLEETKLWSELTEYPRKHFLEALNNMNDEKLQAELTRIHTVIAKLWNEIELALAPTARKY